MRFRGSGGGERWRGQRRRLEGLVATRPAGLAEPTCPARDRGVAWRPPRQRISAARADTLQWSGGLDRGSAGCALPTDAANDNRHDT